MMLYVFHVGVGRMFTFDMTVALSSVENLKDNIQRLHGIPASNIVLMVSGGEMLVESTQVSYYSAGTDTNPIYMFLTGEDHLPSNVPLNLMAIEQTDAELRRQVEESINLPVALETVRRRAQLAQHIYELARDDDRLCERLVHEQHLQQQGWSAVVANLEDLTKEFRERFYTFCNTFDQHLKTRETYEQLLHNFAEDLLKLERVPILPGLMALAEADFHEFDEFLDNDDVFSRSQMQQESVLLAGAQAQPGDEAIVFTREETPVIANDDDGDGDKNSIISTSPLKKAKMGDHMEDDDERPSTSAAAAVAAAAEATATTAMAVATTSDAQERISQSSASSCSRRPNMTLLQWITSKENPNSLQLMTTECEQGLGTFNVEIYERLKTDVQNIIKLADQSDVKEIKGLSERLCKLEEIKYKVKKLVQDQKEISTAIQQNQTRASNIRDTSVLPDLCDSHQNQLHLLLSNHQKIRDFCRCIARAKDELGRNLDARLRRIVWIENSMSEFDNRLLFCHRCLRRAERHINIIEQIHRAPYIYVAAVTEVVRRRTFSGEFRKWASKLAEDFDTIHSEEILRRQEFNTRFEGHFLNILFPGMHDMPPTFANENPLSFDINLPNLTRSDINVLSSQLPDVAPDVQLPDMGPVIDFFVSRSSEHQRERMEELLQQKVAEALNLMDIASNAKQAPQIQRIVELQNEQTTTSAGCDESETDTDTDFEKVAAGGGSTPALNVTVGTSTSENETRPLQLELIARSTYTEPLNMQNVETLTDEYEHPELQEVNRLRLMLKAMSNLALDCLQMARTNVDSIRQNFTSCQTDIETELRPLSEKCKILLKWAEDKQNSEEQQEAKMQSLNTKCAMLETEVDELREQIKNAQQEKDEAVGKAREELIQEHKTEIESLRSRFKLMTFKLMTSPSDTCLESLERPSSSSSEHNVIDVQTHEQMLAQQRSELDAQKERAISAAIDVERCIWQTKLNSESVLANVSILRDMLEEKERQLDQLREQDKLLTNENFQLKTRLDALTNEDGNSWLREKIEFLNRDKVRLEDELNMEKSRRKEMEKSVDLKRSLFTSRHVTLENANVGDIVIVVWSVRHGQFVVLQDSRNLFFVHADSLPGLKLSYPPAYSYQSIAMPYYAIGRVTFRQFCETRRDRNRYDLPKGTQFYRVYMEPLKCHPESKLLEDLTVAEISGDSTVVGDDSLGEITSQDDKDEAGMAEAQAVDAKSQMKDDIKTEAKSEVEGGKTTLEAEPKVVEATDGYIGDGTATATAAGAGGEVVDSIIEPFLQPLYTSTPPSSPTKPPPAQSAPTQ